MDNQITYQDAFNNQDAFMKLPENEQQVLRNQHEDEARKLHEDFKRDEWLMVGKLRENVQEIVWLLAGTAMEKTDAEIMYFLLERKGKISLSSSIDELELSVQTSNVLRTENILLIGDLVQKTEQEIMEIPELSINRFHEIKQWLANKGLGLGMII